MSLRDSMTAEQSAVMIIATEEAYLVNVMDEWRARQRWAESGRTLTPSDLTDDEKRQLIPSFAEVVLDLVNRGWLSVEESAQPLAGNELHAALHDPDSWISGVDTDHRMVMLMTTGDTTQLDGSRGDG